MDWCCEDLKTLCDESASVAGNFADGDIALCDDNFSLPWKFHYCPFCGTRITKE